VDGSPSDEICPCCGIQFGNDDFADGNPDKRDLVYFSWREKWIKDGMQWWSEGTAKPNGWNPSGQLGRLQSHFKNHE